jgi:DNA adenine methylase
MLTDKSYRHLLPTMLKYIDYARKSMTKERFKVCQEELRFWNSRDDIPSDIALKLQASLFFILNRCSFSGTTLSGGSSPGFARFTEGAVNKLHDFIDAIPYYDLRIENKSFEQVLTDLPGNNYPEPFIYLDPPYLIESKLYGNKGDTHHSFDHQLLAEKLLQLPKDIPWLLSYNDCPEIRKLYKSCSMLTPKWKYGMSSNKNSQELLIFPKSISADIRKRAKLAWQHK